VLKHGEEAMIISAQIKVNTNGFERTVPLGIKKSKKNLLMKAEGNKVERVSELAKWLPIQIIHPESHQLVTGGPKNRRQFLDWGVFHVEHSFYETWARYQRVLKQRNAALRQRLHGMDVIWNNELSQLASQLHQFRDNYLLELKKILPKYTQAMIGDQKIEMIYQPGWDTEETLATQLHQTHQRDWQRGYTTQGPHRAEIVFKVNGYKAQGEISRGQQKMLVSALRLAQAELYSQKTGKDCIILVDDLPAELDEKHRHSLMELLREMNAQVFVSCVEEQQINHELWTEKAMFHVEHGNVKQVL
jgi:DNA replication and repair protein RecF